MVTLVDAKACVIVPNWNGEDSLRPCLDSLLGQSLKPYIIVVDNGSHDGSRALLQNHYPDVEIIKHSKNRGYAGGVNPGFRRALELGIPYAAPFNNDAVADKGWLEALVSALEVQPETGIAACKLLSADGNFIDSTGECYTVWGLPYPRGRGVSELSRFDEQTTIFGASGGASLYRSDMLAEIGLFDEDFFAYYEDVDLSFRAQLAGWKVLFVPQAIAYHQTGTTSRKVSGFYAYQTLKNLPWLLWKNVPGRYLLVVLLRFLPTYCLFFGGAMLHGQLLHALRGATCSLWLLPKKLLQRRQIQKRKRVSSVYIWGMLIHDLPPQASRLRKVFMLGSRARADRST